MVGILRFTVSARLPREVDQLLVVSEEPAIIDPESDPIPTLKSVGFHPLEVGSSGLNMEQE